MFLLFKNRNGFNSLNQMMSNNSERIFLLFLGKDHCQGLCLQTETDLIISRKDPLTLALSCILLKMHIQFFETVTSVATDQSFIICFFFGLLICFWPCLKRLCFFQSLKYRHLLVY